MKIIEYYYIYLINNKISMERKTIYIFSVLEDALSTKCIIFSFHLKFNYEQKNCKTGGQKSGFFCINSSKIYKQIPEGKLDHLRSSGTLLLFLNIKKNL